MRILILLDHASHLREPITAALLDAGHEVSVRVDADVVLQELRTRAEAPDVIVLDMLMPRVPGATFRTRQLADPRLGAIPTIVLSNAFVDPAVPVLARGAIAPVRDPFPTGALVAAVEEVARPTSAYKGCRCGRSYDAVTWQELPLLGTVDNGRDVGEELELRHCECGSTIAWELGRHAMSFRLRVHPPV